MKKYISVGLTLLFFLNILSAQVGRNRVMANEKVQAFKVEFFSENLQLTKDEARDFWPIYNQYERDKEALKKQYRLNRKIELIPDAEVEGYINKHLELEQRQLDLKKDLFREMKSVLPIRKVAAIPRTEQQFKKALLAEIKKRREQRRAGG